MINTVYLLHHVHELENGEEDVKLIGVYVTEHEAQKAISRLIIKPGFVHQPEGFQLEAYELGKDHWTDGYSTMTSIWARNINNNDKDKYVGISAAVHPDDVYEICSIDHRKQIEFKIGDFVKCWAYW